MVSNETKIVGKNFEVQRITMNGRKDWYDDSAQKNQV